MIKFSGMLTEFVQVSDCTMRTTPNGMNVLVCPECKEHHFGDVSEVHDCKTIIYEDELTADGKLIQHSQCMCYSESHGVRQNDG